jgi:predicted O-methyltransferase YrrM
MALEYYANDWEKHKMDRKTKPFYKFEDDKNEVGEINKALSFLVEQKFLLHGKYDKALFNLHRKEVKSNFIIPWTGISNRMHRLIYSINAIKQPKNTVAVGIFCGYTFICNAGASIGKGSCYKAEKIIGIEIDEELAQNARKNISKIDKDKLVKIVAVDGIEWFKTYKNKIDLLYIDATGEAGNKSLYLQILKSAYHLLDKNSIVLAHNSVNGGEYLKEYLEFVRNKKYFKKSANLIIDEAGLELTLGKL